MSRKILQVNFRFHVSRAEFETAVGSMADLIAGVPGLLWTLWLVNEAGQEAGGIHLFDDGPSLEAYINSEILAGIIGHPALSDFRVNQFDVLDAATTVTRGPA